MVTERVKGGLRVDLGVHGFVPASQVGVRRLRDLDRMVGRSLRLRVTEADKDQKKVILSHRHVIEEERRKRREQTLAKLVEGGVFKGRVRNLTDYGAFVDLGGVDGLLHVSEMSWTRIKHPSDALTVGDTIEVIVLSIDRERNRISLGRKQILPDPWKEARKSLKVGSVVRGRVTRVVPFGAFVQLGNGIEGIVPNAELSERRGVEAKDVVKVDDTINVKILNMRPEERRMTLSLIQAQQEHDRQAYQEYMRAQQAQRPTLGDLYGDALKQHRAALEAAEAGTGESERAAEGGPTAEAEPASALAEASEEPAEAGAQSEGTEAATADTESDAEQDTGDEAAEEGSTPETPATE
jgi:4-hydroxy-3-methylbut-2-enyl diphosphate reductase